MEILNEIAKELRTSAINTCWRQWFAIGSPSFPIDYRRARAAIDPEALILLSMCFVSTERRLGDIVGWWASVGARLTSFQRLTMLRKFFCDVCEEPFRDFALIAVNAGDRRWLKYAGESLTTISIRKSKQKNLLTLIETPAITLRLRAGIGVGAKSDLLSFMICKRDLMSTVSTLAGVTGYTESGIRLALKGMVLSGFVVETMDRPKEYSVNWRSWTELLGLFPIRQSDLSEEINQPSPPRWINWSEIFYFIHRMYEWAMTAAMTVSDPYLIASQARDILEPFTTTFLSSGISISPKSPSTGEDYLVELLTKLKELKIWLEEEV